MFEDLASQADLDSLAARPGLEFASVGTALATQLLPITDPLHREPTFTRASTNEQLLAYTDLNSMAYGLPLDAGRDAICGSQLWIREVHACLGIHNDLAVTCAAVLENAGRLFVVLVATDPAYGRRGYGEAVTLKALFEGWRATGITHGMLHATVAGAGVYPPIGFESNPPIRFYALGS